MSLIEKLSFRRAYEPGAVESALRDRQRGPALAPGQKILVLACDHPARGALGAGSDPLAMASREEVLRRCQQIMAHPGVGGFLGTADLVEDLALLGSLEGKYVWGSMNRGGLAGASFEMDDRFTGYDAQGVAEAGLDGGKMLLRVNYEDAGSARTIEHCARAVTELGRLQLNVMVEPFISRWQDGQIVNDLSPDAVIKSIAIAQGLGPSTAHTWLKLPAVDEMDRVMEATTLPSLILGGAVSQDVEGTYKRWQETLQLPNVVGLVIGRSLLFPPDGDVDGAVNRLVEML